MKIPGGAIEPGGSLPEEPSDGINEGAPAGGGAPSPLSDALDQLESAQASNPFSQIQTSYQGLDSADDVESGESEVYKQNQIRERINNRIYDIISHNESPDDVGLKMANDSEALPYLSTEERLRFVNALFDGSTGEDEEDAALAILLSAGDDELRGMVGEIGWDRLESELDDEDLEEIRGRVLGKQGQLDHLLQDYDPESSDADEIAVRIAGDPELKDILTRDQKLMLVKGLFDGSTGDDEEQAALSILRSNGDRDVKSLCGELGWDELESELPAGDFHDLQRTVLGPRGVIDEVMRGYDPKSSDADEIAVRIASDTYLIDTPDLLSKEEKLSLIRGLFDGPTGIDEQRAAETLLFTDDGRDLPWLVNKIGFKRMFEEMNNDDWGATFHERVLEQLSLPETNLPPDALAVLDKVLYNSRIYTPHDSENRINVSDIRGRIHEMSDTELKAFVQDVLKNQTALTSEIKKNYLFRPHYQAVQPRLEFSQFVSNLAREVKNRPALAEFNGEMKRLNFKSELNYDLGRDVSQTTAVIKDAHEIIEDPDLTDSEKLGLLGEAFAGLGQELLYEQARAESFGHHADAAALGKVDEQIHALLRSLKEAAALPPELNGQLDRIFDNAGKVEEALQGWRPEEFAGPKSLSQEDSRMFVRNLKALGDQTGHDYLRQIPFQERADLIRGILVEHHTTDEDRQGVLDLLQSCRERDLGESYNLVQELNFRSLYAYLGDQFIDVLDGRYDEGTSESA